MPLWSAVGLDTRPCLQLPVSAVTPVPKCRLSRNMAALGRAGAEAEISMKNCLKFSVLRSTTASQAFLSPARKNLDFLGSWSSWKCPQIRRQNVLDEGLLCCHRLVTGAAGHVLVVTVDPTEVVLPSPLPSPPPVSSPHPTSLSCPLSGWPVLTCP